MNQDPLIERIAKIKKQQEESDYKRKKAVSELTSTRITDQVSFFQKVFGKIFSVATIIFHSMIYIFNTILEPFLGKLFNVTKKLWNKFVYRKDEFNNDRFSPTRAAIFCIAVFIQWSLIFVLVDLTYYTGLYLLTSHKNEVVYMTNSQEVDPNRDTYSAQGCESLPCDENSSVYFRIDPILFNHLYSIVHDGNIFYPDYVAASIPPSITKCTITSYGIRIKTLMRGFDVYPYLLRASCEPVIQLQK